MSSTRYTHNRESIMGYAPLRILLASNFRYAESNAQGVNGAGYEGNKPVDQLAKQSNYHN